MAITCEEHGLSGPSGSINTIFTYNAISELLKTTDNAGNETSYTYNNLDRKISATYPDAGLTTFAYDPAGNMTQKTTAQLRKDIPKGGAHPPRPQCATARYEKLKSRRGDSNPCLKNEENGCVKKNHQFLIILSSCFKNFGKRAFSVVYS